jgi:hypothetical protein
VAGYEAGKKEQHDSTCSFLPKVCSSDLELRYFSNHQQEERRESFSLAMK